jgi:pyridoxine/pyridoxamine 5'-phosphate oxidase
MSDREPTAELDPTFSSVDAIVTSWTEARSGLEHAEVFWLATVRPDGRPHCTPLISVWLDGACWFVTGPTERKALNLDANPHCVLTTGCNDLSSGLDVIVEGDAAQVTDRGVLERVAAAFRAKYPDPFKFTLADFNGGGGNALVFRIVPRKAFGFRHLPISSQTRLLFTDA